MRRPAQLWFILVILGCASMPGCFWSRKPKATQAPLPAPPQAPAPAVVPAPRTPPVRTRHSRPARKAARPPAKDTPHPSPTPPANPPELIEMLSPEEKADLTRSCNESLSAARDSLSQVAGRPMARDQIETRQRINSFIIQAESAKQTDLTVAAQLARRAELLARDLLNSLH